jgi:hypothetical protein
VRKTFIYALLETILPEWLFHDVMMWHTCHVAAQVADMPV